MLNMKKLVKGFLVGVVLACLTGSGTQADPLNFEVSGMAPLGDGGGFLTVLDT